MFWLSSKEGQGVNVLKPNQRATVITLLERSTPQREIARITGIDRKTIRSYHQRWLADPANSPGVATGSEAVATQIPPPWPPAFVCTSSSLCEVHRDFIEAQMRLRRNAMAIYQDLVDAHGFTAAYNSVKRFVRALRKKVGANETVVPASELQEAMRRIKQLEGALGRKTLENEILKEAVDFAKAKKWIARSPVLPGASSESRLLCPWRVAQPCVDHERSIIRMDRLEKVATA